jgi:hypothetical protein
VKFKRKFHSYEFHENFTKASREMHAYCFAWNLREMRLKVPQNNDFDLKWARITNFIFQQKKPTEFFQLLSVQVFIIFWCFLYLNTQKKEAGVTNYTLMQE